MELEIIVAVTVFRGLFLRCSLNFFAVLRCSRPPHVSLLACILKRILETVAVQLRCVVNKPVVKWLVQRWLIKFDFAR